MSVKSSSARSQASMSVSEEDESSSEITPRGVRKRIEKSSTGVKEEKLKSLVKSRGGFVAVMSRLQREIQELIEQNGATSDVEVKLTTYNKTWMSYVNIHEKILHLLEKEEENLQAFAHYEEQRNKKIYLEQLVSSCCETSSKKQGRRSVESKQAKSSRRSSRSSLSERRESVALAELKIRQIERKQALRRRQRELLDEEEKMDAEIRLEEAKTRLFLFDDDDGASQNLDGMSEYYYNASKLNVDEDDDDNRDKGTVLRNDGDDKQTVRKNDGDDKQTVRKNDDDNDKQTVRKNDGDDNGRSDNDIHGVEIVQEHTVNTEGTVRNNDIDMKLMDHNMCITNPVCNLNAPQMISHGTLPTYTMPVVSTCICTTAPTLNTASSVLHNIPAFVYQPTIAHSSPISTSSNHNSFPNCEVSPVLLNSNQSVVKHDTPITVNSSDPYPSTPVLSRHDHFQGTVPYVYDLSRENNSHLSRKAGCRSALSETREHDVPLQRQSLTDETGEQIVKALTQVVNTPKIEYMHFDGDPSKYISFTRNFETCLEKDTVDDSRKLQLLIQHCTGKARDSIESCVNLPEDVAYKTAKETLKENFGKPHVIAQVYLQKLESIPPIKTVDGPTLLDFARQLTEAERTLRGMGSDYVSDIDHIKTLRMLNRKLPLFLRSRWTEVAGKILESGQRPKFADFLAFVKERAKLVNNEFGEDLTVTSSKDRLRDKPRRDSHAPKLSSFVTSVNSKQEKSDTKPMKKKCLQCAGEHNIWKCDAFKELTYKQRKDVVRKHRLCMKCLGEGHFMNACGKKDFKCQIEGCKEVHHTLLHPPNTSDPTTSDSTKGEQVNSPYSGPVAAITGAGDKRVCLGVIPVKVSGLKKGNTKYVSAYALLDSGSEVTLCHEQLSSELNLEGDEVEYTLTGITGSSKVKSKTVNLAVRSIDESFVAELTNVKTVKEMPISTCCIVKREDLKSWSYMSDVNLCELERKEVLLIIGAKELPGLFVPLETRMREYDEPVAIRYSLGWTVMGQVGGSKVNGKCSINFLRVEDSMDARVIGSLNSKEAETLHRTSDEQLEQQLQSLWRTDFADSVVDATTTNSVEDQTALEHMENTLTKVNGRYQVGLPWKKDPPQLPNNKMMASRRCALLKKRLEKDEDLFAKYSKAMNEYISQGHAEKVPEEDTMATPKWYLPHHPVVHPMKPEKVRIVFDCAAKFGGTSLNQELKQGPDLTNQLTGVLTRFRQERIGVVADVEGMFHQVLVDPKDCNALRFLWWKDGDLSKELEDYRMVKHVFGATSSPSIANFVLRKTAELENEGIDPETTETVKNNMYVDDLMKSIDCTDRAIDLVKQLCELLSRGGFRLTKWYSNDRAVLASIPETERAQSVVNLDMERLPTQSALGLKWNTEVDNFVWTVSDKALEVIKKKPFTRRGVVSVAYSLFDPLGFIAPFIMKAKLLLQMLSRKGIHWDELMPEEERKQWLRWQDDLPKLQDVFVERCFKPEGFGNVQIIELHLFSDASRVGYSAVAYLRLVNDQGKVHCAMVMAKARVAPIREISIPRLELTAAVISVKLSNLLQRQLEWNIQRVIYWTDSTSVLKCIYNTTKRFHTFESNRLTIIHSGSKPDQWRYVNRDDNPADDGSKGLKMDDMLKSKRWFKGPRFLWEDESRWPKMVPVPAITDDDEAVRKECQIYTFSSKNDSVNDLLMYHSSWWKLTRAVAWLLRYKLYLRGKVRTDSSNRQESSFARHLTLSEIIEAEKAIIKQVQTTEFPEVLNTLTKNVIKDNDAKKYLKKAHSSIYKLSPNLREGILRAGGRLLHSDLSRDSKCPVILPYKHHVTDLIIDHHHMNMGHVGQESVLSSLRRKYWIIKGRSAIRRVIRKCMSCQRRSAQPGEQYMSDLPKDRVTANQPPFTYVGTDYFGPFEVKQGRSRVKRYGCLFTCLNTRAVHIEIAHSLDTSSMINALRRFVSIRGYPQEIRSDQGTNFVKADKELKEALKELDQAKINNYCALKEIQWNFNPPSASHMGGAWERIIRSVRQILKAILKEQIVNDEVLSTVMAEVVYILNSRPLTRNSDSPLDDQPLTPNHLLHLRPSPSLPPGIFSEDDCYLKRSWKQAQYLADVFWRRWQREYLPTLLQRKKWNLPRRNLREGDLVLLADETYPRGEWPLARVVEVMTSKDGYVRSAKVKTCSTVATRAKRQRKGEYKSSTTVLTRPITKLCFLEMDHTV